MKIKNDGDDDNDKKVLRQSLEKKLKIKATKILFSLSVKRSIKGRKEKEIEKMVCLKKKKKKKKKVLFCSHKLQSDSMYFCSAQNKRGSPRVEEMKD